MESIVIYRDRQELQSADMNNAQEFTRESLDHAIKDAIDPGKGYTGFSATKTAATEVTMSAGRLYAAGAVYARNEDVVIDLFNVLPLVTRKRVAIVSYGQEVETDVQPRDFLIDAQTGTTEPQSVAMESFRRAELSSVAGTEGPDPAYPAVDAGMTIIAYILLDTQGIVAIEQWKPSQLPNLRDISNRTVALESWRGQISGQVDTLRTDLSALADRLQGYALKSEIVSLTEQLDELREEVYAPGAYIWYGTNHFLDETGSNTGHVDFDAVVNEGIRFPMAASNTGAIALLDPNNVFVKPDMSGGLVIPSYDHKIRMDLTGYSDETRLAQYTFETTTVRRLTRTRERRRYGPEKKVCTNGRWWRQGRYDLARNVFHIDGETWEVTNGVPDEMPNGDAVMNGNVHWIRVRQFWIDAHEEPYWDRVSTSETINGQQVAQTFLNSQDGWLSQIGLFFSRKADAGDVHALIAETRNGMPDLKRVISRTTLPAAGIENSVGDGNDGLPALKETRLVITPTYLKAGRRYALILITTGDHYVAMTDTDNGTVQGTFFVSTDGAFFAGNLVDDMKMRLYFAKFDRPRVAIEMSALDLSGGILDVDLLHEAITPPACRADVELQVNGAWVAMAGHPNGPDLTGLPNLVPMRYVFTGTTDLMPAMVTTNSQSIVSRPKTSFAWISEAKTLASPTTGIKVIVELQGYDEANHDCTISLLTGAALDGAEAADVVEDAILPDGTIRRTCTFNVTSVSDYAVKIVGGAVSAADLFLVSEMIEYAQT
ncbi:hypothetical protein [Aquicoccus sp.]|uniref:hypothetical protein n=1 Tax=Aquicoccus sp. TaxID=2055851 RepID=UPI003569D47A